MKLEVSISNDSENFHRACERFFGDVVSGVTEMQEPPYDSGESFIEWCAATWRGVAGGKTVVERLLEDEESPFVRRLLEARLETRPRFYRVLSLDPATSRVGLIDVWSGEKTTVLDAKFAESAIVDWVIALRVLATPIGNLCAVAGPPLRQLDFQYALGFLEDLGMPPGPRGLDERPELLGRLYNWRRNPIEPRGGMPQLQNTDGDPLVLQTATFSFEERAAVLAMLGAHKEIVKDDSNNTNDEQWFTWVRTTSKDQKALGGPTVFGRITVSAAELRIEVNSDRRLEFAREMLESIRGVRFVGTKVTPTDFEAVKARSRERTTISPVERNDFESSG